MSGFSVAYNAAKRTDTEKMIRTIRHRGGAFSGRCEAGIVSMAQTYLSADITHPMPSGPACRVPVEDFDSPGVRICYDGQIGNRTQLAESLFASWRR